MNEFPKYYSMHVSAYVRHSKHECNILNYKGKIPVQTVGRFKAWVCGRSIAGIAVSKPAGGKDVCHIATLKMYNIKSFIEL